MPRIIALMLTCLFLNVSAQNELTAELRSEIERLNPPASIEAFSSVWHFPPVNQDTTLYCWSFATVSFIESEMMRTGLKPVKLAVMFPVYYAFQEKARYFIRTKGTSRFAPGDLFSGVLDMIRQHGIVPAEVYRGQVRERHTYNHDALYAELDTLMERVKTDSLWDESVVLPQVIAVLNRHMGEPPRTFRHEGKTYTPHSFLRDVVTLPWDEYVTVTSFLYAPFDTFTDLRVPDNWNGNTSFFNVPLPLFYESLKNALQNGYSAAFDADISETGRFTAEDLSFVPSFDIPDAFITQAAREFRFQNGSTTDDHLMHAVGITSSGTGDWFLIKDSWRTAWDGKFGGYIFANGGYMKLKALAYLVHREAIPEISNRITTE